MNRNAATTRWFALTLVAGLAAGWTVPLLTQQPQVSTMMAEIPTVPTPNFKGMTLDQAKAANVTSKTKGGQPVSIFRSISTQGPVDGVVLTQTPAANVPVYPGRNELTLTMQPQQAPAWTKIVQSIFQPRRDATVPPLTNDTCEVATEALKAQRLLAACSGDTGGLVVEQYPPAKTSVAFNSTVSVTLRVPLVVVPPLAGQMVADAEQTLAARNLRVGVVTSGGKGVGPLPIVAQSPLAGTSVSAGSPVDVTLQTPDIPQPPVPPPVVVPYLEKSTMAGAVNLLEGVGLRLGSTTGDVAGVVIRQVPAAGNPVDPGSPVDITLAVPVVLVEVPDVVSQSLAVASSRLKLMPLTGDPRYPQGDSAAASMVVGAEDPVPGTMVAEGSSVVLTMAPGSTSTPWTRIAVWGLVVLAGIGAGVLTWHHFFPGSVVTTVAHANPAKAKISCTNSPAIQFTIILRDRPVIVSYRSTREPGVVKKGHS